MLVLRRLSLLLGVAAVIGGVTLALHATAQPPQPGQYVTWAPPATATASPGAGPVVPLGSAPPVASPGILGGLTSPVSGLFKQLNTNTAETATGQYTLIQSLETAVAGHIQQFLHWVTGGR
jgi:hypothetical protein